MHWEKTLDGSGGPILPADTTYTFVVDASYRVTAKFRNTEDPTQATPITIPYEGTHTLAEETTGVDWYRAELDAGKAYRLYATDYFSGIDMVVYGPASGGQVGPDIASAGTPPDQTFNVTQSGTYHVRVSHLANYDKVSSTQAQTYTLHIEEAPVLYRVLIQSRRALEVAFTLTPPDVDGLTDEQSPANAVIVRRYPPGTEVTFTAPEFSGGNQFEKWVRRDQSFQIVEEHTALSYTFNVDAPYELDIVYQNLEDPADAIELAIPISRSGTLAHFETDVHWYTAELTDALPYIMTMGRLAINAGVTVYGPASGSGSGLDIGPFVGSVSDAYPSWFRAQGTGTYYFRVADRSNFQSTAHPGSEAAEPARPGAYHFEVREALQAKLNVGLSGFYAGPDMRVLSSSQLPPYHPYGPAPWEVPIRLPRLFTVPLSTDWVLVELWEDEGSDSVVDKVPQVVLSTGEVTNMMYRHTATFFDAPPGEYYVAVRHRNHIDVRSAEKVTLSSTTLPTVDFTAAGTMAHGTNAMRQMPNGEWALHAGDANADCTVDASDLTDIVLTAMGATGYHAADLNHDWAVSNQDFLTAWLESNGASCAFE
ncbi:MAG: hypothetical protein AAGI08_07405 [Bacteroidota bacterium]